MGTLGTGGQAILRSELPLVRESEMRAVLEMYGARPPIFLDYKDQELKDVETGKLVKEIVEVLDQVSPDVVITFGPQGISHHEDHVTLHKAVVDAFQQYRPLTGTEPRLFYVAIPKEVADKFGMNLDGPDVEPTTLIDIKQYMPFKIKALRMYRSQEDAQWLADVFEQSPLDLEGFHQAYPPVPRGHMIAGFWE